MNIKISLHLALAFHRADSDVHFEVKSALTRGKRIWQVDWPGWGETSHSYPKRRRHNFISAAYGAACVSHWADGNWITKPFNPSPTLIPVWRILVPFHSVFFKVADSWYRRLMWSDLHCKPRMHAQPFRLRKDSFSEFMVPSRRVIDVKTMSDVDVIINDFLVDGQPF